MNEQGAKGGGRSRSWWSRWRLFVLAWPGTVLLLLLGWLSTEMLQSRLPMAILFPLAAALSVTELPRLLVTVALWSQWPGYVLVANVGARRHASRIAMPAVLLLHLAGIGFASPPFSGPSLSTYGRRLAEAAGPEARDCGIVPLPRDPGASIACAQAALAKGRPFWVAFQIMGTDSTIYVGLAYRAKGKATLMVWDSDVYGGANLVPIHRISEKPCVAPVIEDAEGDWPITCGDK